MKTLALKFPLHGPDWLFRVPSANPLQNSGALQPVFDTLLADLRSRKLPDTLEVTLELPAADAQPGVIAALREGWQRVTDHRQQCEQQRKAELVFTRQRFLLKGLLILAISLGIGSLLPDSESGMLRTLAESLIIGGWVAVWVPLERVFYTGWPIDREIAILQLLRDCNLQIKSQG